MQQVPAAIWAAFERRLDQAQVPADQRPDYHKWVRFYFGLMLLTIHGNSLLRPARLRFSSPPKRGRVIRRLRTRVPGTTI